MSDDYRDEIKKLPKVVRPISDEELASFDIAEILGTKKAAKIERTSPEKIEMPIQKRTGRKKQYASDPEGNSMRSYSVLARKVYGGLLPKKIVVEGRSSEPALKARWDRGVHLIRQSWGAYVGGTDGERIPPPGYTVGPNQKVPRSELMYEQYKLAYEFAGVPPEILPPVDRNPTVREMEEILCEREETKASLVESGILLISEKTPQKQLPGPLEGVEQLQKEAHRKADEMREEENALKTFRSRLVGMEEAHDSKQREFHGFLQALEVLGVDISLYQ